MKIKNHLIAASMAALLLLSACQPDKQLTFNSEARVQWRDTTTLLQTFITKKDNVLRDTVYLEALLIGGMQEQPRKVNIKQVVGYRYEYKYDKAGNITDTIATEIADQAVAGVHYVPFDSEEMQQMLLLKSYVSSGVAVKVPVILLRHESLKEKTYRLYVELQASPDFLQGESNKRTKAISIADRLIKPSKWTPAIALTLGNYSYTKHKFMNETLGTVVDDAWLSQPLSLAAYYREECRRALDAFNADPANIASGSAPLREDPANPKSPLITFPTTL